MSGENKMFDTAFTAKTDAWQIAALDPAFKAANDAPFDPENRKIVLLTFENRFAALGGLAAVMRLMPQHLQKYGEDVTVMTPLYKNIYAVKNAIADGVLKIVFDDDEIELPSGKYKLTCCKHEEDALVSYHIGIEGRFTASHNPYSYANSIDILDDSLAFCAALPKVLARLNITENILFHAQDWETAPVAVTSKIAVENKILKSARTVLTLHNSFDSGLSAVKREFFFGKNVRGETILQCAIPLLNGPLTTVSTPFADELRDDPLQRTVFTSHLQKDFLRNPPIGVENGMFGKPYLRYTYGALTRARQGDPSKLLAEKTQFRKKMTGVVGAMDHPGVIGELKNLSDDRPIFFMSGRFDLMQKGFDVIFHALEKIPAGKIALIFCPSSAERTIHNDELTLFKKVTADRAGDIVMWPFRISSEDYAAVLLGSSFLIMPSFYEPFGAATEGFMHGTPVIARATGGLLAQVRDRAYESGGKFCGNNDSTGVMYREKNIGSVVDLGAEWRRILDVPVSKRVEIPLYASMVEEAKLALERAAEIFADADKYGNMMVCGMDSLRNFSWDTAAWKYRRIYETASRRGFVDS